MKKSQGPIWKRIERDEKSFEIFFFILKILGKKTQKSFQKFINFNSLLSSYQLSPTYFERVYPDEYDMKSPCDSELLSLSPDKCIFLTIFFCHKKITINNFFKISIIIITYINKTIFIIDCNNCIIL
jgi:hypothetical protein